MNVGASVLGGSAIPGDPGGLVALAAQLQTASSDVASVQERVATNGLQGSWSGAAAEAFRGSLNKLPGELAKVATAFGDASRSVSTFAGTLEELQANASKYATEITDLHVELRGAQVRQDEAQTRVAAARLAHSLASDPFSLHTAAAALNVGLGIEQTAVAEVEEIGAEIARFVSLAESNRITYEDAVRTCCAAFGSAYEGGTSSFGAWAERHARSVAGLLEGSWGAVRREGDRVAHDAETDVVHATRDVEHEADAATHAALTDLDRHWTQIRGQILRVSADLSNATLIANIALPILAITVTAASGGALAPLGLAMIAADADINAADTVATNAASAAVVGGDAIEAARGSRVAEQELPGDAEKGVINAAASHFGSGAADKVSSTIDARLASTPALRDTVAKLVVIDTVKQSASNAAGEASTLVGNEAQKAIAAVPDAIRSVIAAPFVRPESLLIPIPTIATPTQ
jgi:uncharacterized protein YukE